MQITITAKIKILPDTNQMNLLKQTFDAYKKGCNFVSEYIFESKNLVQAKVQKYTYSELRKQIGLRSQMSCSVTRTVIARYKTLKSNGHDWSKVKFKRPEYDLVWNRDYSFKKDYFSINTLEGRIKVKYNNSAMEKYFDGSWNFGTAKLVYKHGKFFLHIPMTKDIQELEEFNVSNVVGIDMGINFTATTYDSKGKTIFFNGRQIKHKRAKYSYIRKQLQQKKTPSSRRRLKSIGQRENRWMTDVNHQISKALLDRYGRNTLFVVEDLTGIRTATEKVRIKDRYKTVSWSFYQLRSFLEYKAQLNGSKVIAVDPKYTSQTCPKCGHIEKANRNKKLHTFKCKNCNYESNDDRIGAMNLYQKGIEYIGKVTVGV